MYPIKLNAKLAALIAKVGQADGAPTQASEDVGTELSRRIDAQLVRLRKLTTHLALRPAPRTRARKPT